MIISLNWDYSFWNTPFQCINELDNIYNFIRVQINDKANTLGKDESMYGRQPWPDRIHLESRTNEQTRSNCMWSFGRGYWLSGSICGLSRISLRGSNKHPLIILYALLLKGWFLPQRTMLMDGCCNFPQGYVRMNIALPCNWTPRGKYNRLE